MTALLVVLTFLLSASELSLIDKEKEFLKKENLYQSDLIKFFGSPHDSLKKGGLKLLIWDNIFGKMTLHSAPPNKPLDSAESIGKRVFQAVIIDSTGKLQEYDYWDYTNPQDFIDRGLINK